MRATLIDTTKCIGCRSCQVSCKAWNDLPAVKTELQTGTLGLQNPKVLSSKTFTVVTFHEIEDRKAPGGLRYVSAKRQCMHCDEPACASACPVTALHKTAEGPVDYDSSKCIGCRYCMWACPFGVPTVEWDKLAPSIHKCTGCADRVLHPVPALRNGQPLTADDAKRFAAAHAVPACVEQCPAGALTYGERDDMLAEAKRRIAASPGRYVNRVYGEKEAGGTSTLYLAAVPFQELGFPEVGTTSYPARSKVALSAVPPAVIAVGAALGGTYALSRRRAEVARKEPPIRKEVPPPPAKAEEHHVEFERLPTKLWTPTNVFLAALAAFAGLSFVVRFALGLGGSTGLSDTWAWGLWIVFDFVWISIAAGAFATAGLIYVLRRDDLYSMGRSAVLMGLLSYTFVVVTLIADLGLPWHFWQLAFQAPEHSAMFEVSWCIALYLTILALEFVPVALERFKLDKATELWRRYSPVWVVVAVSLFVYLMSRKPLFALAAFAVFGLLAYLFRQRPGEKYVPIMLAIAAVTFSTMHQSSLGSIFLLMPDKLDPVWWSPIMPVAYFPSSGAAGTALMVLIEMWIAKGFRRTLRLPQLAAMGQVAFWALLVYEVVRLGDLAFRGELGRALVGPRSGLFLLEVAVCGLLPLVLLSTRQLRGRVGFLALGSALSVLGVILNRSAAVLFAMNMKGPMPQIAPSGYVPSIFEWGISVGLVAATILLFGWGARLFPVLPKEEAQKQS
ncbi:MAG TPA: 4Fe-4S dicluster domain-containing protein [Anaeromyxobacteraceae bacterium]|nr:4Fe-4S dicluster domain-containing protein [Anaeromyxobacteraceae bacterium]